MIRSEHWPRTARRIVWGVVVIDLAMVVLIMATIPLDAKYSSPYRGWLLLASATSFLVDQGLIQSASAPRTSPPPALTVVA